MRCFGAICVVALLASGCAPTITYDTGGTSSHEPGGDTASGHGGAGDGASGPIGDGGVASGGGPSSSSSSTTTGAGGAGGLGPTGAQCSAEDQSGSLFGAACAYAPCSDVHAPPAMVQITAADGTSYCMDTRTVTAGDYSVFLAANVAPSQQPSRCLWNKTFVPGATTDPPNQQCPKFAYDPVGAPDAPVTCVDLCDAEAYCLWAGKRLCGHIGGGDVEYADDGKPSLDQFTYACQDEMVHFEERPAADVFEWEPVCLNELSATSLCNVRDLQCYLYDNWAASRQDTRLGFRCCAD